MKIGYGHNIMYMLLCNQFYNVPPFETIKLGMRGDGRGLITIEVFRNEMLTGRPVSLPALLKDLNVELILISGFMNSEITSNTFFVELILISEITNSEIKFTSTLGYFCQSDSLPGFHFEKPLMLS